MSNLYFFLLILSFVDVLKELDDAYERYRRESDSLQRRKLQLAIQRALIRSQELGDEKIQIAGQMVGAEVVTYCKVNRKWAPNRQWNMIYPFRLFLTISHVGAPPPPPVYICSAGGVGWKPHTSNRLAFSASPVISRGSREPRSHNNLHDNQCSIPDVIFIN